MDILRHKLMTDDMTRHGVMMTIFSVSAGLFSYLYQVSMGRLLTPDQYGTLFSLLALFTIIAVIARVIQTSVTKFSSRFKAMSEMGKVNYLWRFSLKHSFIFGLAVFIILASLTQPLSRFLNISNYWYIIIVALSFLFNFVLSAGFGMLQGLQRFLPLGISNTLASFLKLFLGVLMVYGGLEVYGGLLALVLAPLLVFFITAYFLRDLSMSGSEKFQTRGVFAYSGLASIAILCYLALISMDVILAKHFLSAAEVGNYSAISVLGRIVLFAPGGITLAMFPKTSELFEKRGDHRRVLKKAMLLTILLAGLILLVYLIFPNPIINLAFGTKYTIGDYSLFKYGAAMLFFTISSLLINYFLSLNVMKVGYVLIAAVVVELCLISIFHSSVEQIIDMFLVSGATSLVLLLLFHFKLRKII